MFNDINRWPLRQTQVKSFLNRPRINTGRGKKRKNYRLDLKFFHRKKEKRGKDGGK
jgi:hypothetical protein